MVEVLKINQELTRKWVQLRNEFHETGQDLPPPSFLQGPNPMRPSDTEPIDSRTSNSHRSPMKRTAHPARTHRYTRTRKTRRVESKVGESHHSSHSKPNKTYANRETYKRVRTERSLEPTCHTTTAKKSLSIELGPFTK